jgi:hypothetical protein
MGTSNWWPAAHVTRLASEDGQVWFSWHGLRPFIFRYGEQPILREVTARLTRALLVSALSMTQAAQREAERTGLPLAALAH